MVIKTIDASLCNGCGFCDAACPVDVIYMDQDSQTAEIAFPDDCMTCFNCELECPTDAIYVDPMKHPKPQPW